MATIYNSSKVFRKTEVSYDTAVGDSKSYYTEIDYLVTICDKSCLVYNIYCKSVNSFFVKTHGRKRHYEVIYILSVFEHRNKVALFPFAIFILPFQNMTH